MIGSGASLALLALALLLGLFGTWDLLMAASRRDVLRERASGERAADPVVRLLATVERAIARTRRGRRLGVALTAGAIRMTPLQFLAAAVGAALAAFVVMTLLFSTVISVLGALAVLRGAFAYLRRRRDQRRDRFVGQLPDLARVLSNATSAGLSVTAALEIAVNELEEPAETELRIALEEVRIGQSFESAFAHLGERMPSRELGVLVNTLVIQQRAGGDLVRALSDMEATLDARKDTLREVKTIMAGAVATAYMVAAIGIGAIFFLDAVRPGTLDALTGSVIGLIVIAVSSLFYIVGFALVRRVVRIEP